MINSKYAPINSSEYGAKDLNSNFQGTFFTAVNSTTTQHDYLVTDDHIIDGSEISVIGDPALGDYLIAQVVDKDNVLGYGVNVTLNTFIPKWYVVPGIIKQINSESKYPAKIYSGLYLRIKYVSVGLVNVDVVVNLKLHKVLW